MQQGQGSYASLPLLMKPRIAIMLQCGNSRDRGRKFPLGRDSHMAARILRRSKSPESAPSRGALLRWLDTLAEWQMRHSHSVISRVQADNATMIGVTQPSSTNERSSISPCDR